MTLPAYRLAVKNSAGTVSADTNPSTGSITISTTTTTTNMARFATVIGNMAKIRRTCDRSDDARAINWPVVVSSWKVKARRCMWANMRFRRSASAR